MDISRLRVRHPSPLERVHVTIIERRGNYTDTDHTKLADQLDFISRRSFTKETLGYLLTTRWCHCAHHWCVFTKYLMGKGADTAITRYGTVSTHVRMKFASVLWASRSNASASCAQKQAAIDTSNTAGASGRGKGYQSLSVVLGHAMDFGQASATALVCATVTKTGYTSKRTTVTLHEKYDKSGKCVGAMVQ